ncbi:MAG: hypothetical protein RQ757_06970 [Pseudomonadales bacterium]|nr:hypothetical protein [Pseudomonadales bacterium]
MLSQSSLSARIVTEFEAQGGESLGEHSWVTRMADALAAAVVQEITENAIVQVSGGSSAGLYSVQ